MKVIISILISASLVLGELPPPYPASGFRPNPPFNLPVRQPQTSYGAPNAAPSKFSQSAPQTQYGAPNQQRPNSVPNLTPSLNSKQTIPSTSYGVPVTSTPYRTVLRDSQISSGFPSQQQVRPAPNLTPSFTSKQTVPGTSYEAPVTSIPYRTIVSEPQATYGTPNAQSRPSPQYGAPDFKNIEALEQIRQLNLLLQLSQSSNSNQQNQDFNLSQSPNSNRNVEVPSQQYLPVKDATNFRESQYQFPQGNIQQPSQQYLPVKEPTNFRNGFDLPGSNFQKPLNVAISNPNLRQPQQRLSVKEATSFRQETANRPNNNLEVQNYRFSPNSPQSSLSKLVDSNQQHRPRTNTNAALTSSNNFQIERLNVRRLPNSKEQTSAEQNVAQKFQQNRELGDFEQISDRYLPPTTTVSTVLRPTRGPVSSPKDSSNEDEQSTESKEEAGGPNIAIATAVSGAPGGQSFYLLQPDGRLQRVIYQKTSAEGDRENEYTANYLFQNIQADPGLVYSPLVTLGKR